ncbi:MAG: glycosyltransferase [Bacteroidota bacterium]
MDSIKLLQLNTVVNSGSTGRITEDIGQVMMSHGHESYIAYGRGDRPSQSNLIKIGSQLDVVLHGVKTALFDRHGFGSRRATEQLVEAIEHLQPDVIGMHNIHGYYLNIEVLFDYFSQVDTPVVWTLHDCWSFTGHCAFYSSIACERWRSLCHDCPKKSKYPRTYFLDNSRQNYQDKKAIFNGARNLHLVTPSQWLADEVGESYLSNLPITVIHNGVDTTAFAPQQELSSELAKGLQGRKVVLGVANIWDERKGLSQFIQLAERLPADYQIVLVGLTSQQVEQLPDTIIGLTRTESLKELADLYTLASVYCNPTFEDNFPNTNIEALACGTPVVAYHTGGCPEAVDAATGLIVAKGDIDGLAEAVIKIISQGRAAFEAPCRQRALDQFEKKDRYHDYLHLYERLLSIKA